MPLLADYAITPDVFDAASYLNEELGRAYLQQIKRVLLSEGLVRDLREGEWRKVFSDNRRSWHRHGKELLKKLAAQGRLVRFSPALDSLPANDAEWCAEALGTQHVIPFTGGVIVTEPVKADYLTEPLVARIDRLSSARWWAARSSSVRLARHVAAYQEHLAPVLRCANSIMFIDPHVDPKRSGYRGFATLLADTGARTPVPVIEIHRVCWEEPRDKRPRPEFMNGLEQRFNEAFANIVSTAGIKVEVFLWDDFHDRYLISNLIGISLPNGLDTTTDPNNLTTWTRLGRDDRDNVQREFDPASGRHELRHRFVLE